MGQAKRHRKLLSQLHDLRFGEPQQRRVNADSGSAFDPGFGRQVGHALVSFDEFRAAIGVAGVIEGIHADEKVAGAQHFAPGERKR